MSNFRHVNTRVQPSEFGKRKSEIGKRKSEYGVRKAELGVRKSEFGNRKTERGKRKTELGKRKTENGKRSSVSRWASVLKYWSVGPVRSAFYRVPATRNYPRTTRMGVAIKKSLDREILQTTNPRKICTLEL